MHWGNMFVKSTKNSDLRKCEWSLCENILFVFRADPCFSWPTTGDSPQTTLNISVYKSSRPNHSGLLNILEMRIQMVWIRPADEQTSAGMFRLYSAGQTFLTPVHKILQCNLGLSPLLLVLDDVLSQRFSFYATGIMIEWILIAY